MATISIEGNIGSGKSSLIEEMKQRFPSIIFVDEPVKDWALIYDADGVTMLEKFYKNKHAYAFSFQMMAFISRLKLLRKARRENPDAIIITERSLYTDKLVFAKMLFENGFIEDVNYKIYLTWFDEFAIDCPIDKIIYVKTDPEICFERINKRGRLGEDSIPFDYIQECNTYHEHMLTQPLSNCKPNEQLILDGNINNIDGIESWIQQIHSYIYTSPCELRVNDIDEISEYITEEILDEMSQSMKINNWVEKWI